MNDKSRQKMEHLFGQAGRHVRGDARRTMEHYLKPFIGELAKNLEQAEALLAEKETAITLLAADLDEMTARSKRQHQRLQA